MVVELIDAVFVNAPSAIGRFTVIVMAAVSALSAGAPVAKSSAG